MVQAAAANGLDFKAADPRNRNWWLKLKWITDQLEDFNAEKVYALQHSQHTRIISYETRQEAFDKHWKAANEILQNIYSINFPWAKDANKKRQEAENNDLMSRWKKRYGDIKDPAVREKYKKIAQAMRRHAELGKKDNFKSQRSFKKALREKNARDNIRMTRNKK
jgi:hypothetical protein